MIPTHAPTSLSPELRAELLHPEAWNEVLTRYARASELSLGLIDADGNLLGDCHNPQPVWELVRKARNERCGKCPFCLWTAAPCGAAEEVLESGGITIAHDGIGMAYVTVPLRLDDEPVGVLIAGQVFDRYPDRDRVRLAAAELGIPAEELWELATQQTPFSQATLVMFGELMLAFGQAFLRQRYQAIAESKQAAANRRARVLMDSIAGYAIYTEDGNGRVTSWSSAAERMFGFTEAEVIGREAPWLFKPEEIQNGARQQELRTAEQEGLAHSESWQARKDGSRFLAKSILAKLALGNGVEFGRIVRDITEERKQAEAALEARKLASISVLTAGLAHDFNNLLAGVLINAGSLLEETNEGDPAQERLEDIISAGQAVAGLTDQLLSYSGAGRPINPATVDFSALVRKTMRLARPLIPEHVSLKTTAAANLPLIEGDAGFLQNVVVNLVINAGEAIGAAGGLVQVSTGAAAGEVYLEVRDSGCGMDEETRARIFEPFFTKKFLGRGLGLAAVAGIVRLHNGRIVVKSAVGEGTTFRIYLPAIQA